MKQLKYKIHASVLILLWIIIPINSYPAENELLSKLKIDRDIISSAIESINLINKSQLLSINSLTSDSMITYSELLKQLNSADLQKENVGKLYELYTACIKAHRNYIHESKTRIKDNLDLISELKEMYPDIFKSTFCIDSISKYNETLSVIEKNRNDETDIYEIIKLIIISDRTFAAEISEFKLPE